MRFPNLFNAARALWRVIVSLFKREPVLVSEEVFEARIGTCRACKQYDLESGQCLACTCFVDLKAQLSTETCPLKKWKV